MVFLGLARNCAPHIPQFEHFLDQLSTRLDVTAVVGENGSTDGTAGLLTAARHIRRIDTTWMAKIQGRLERQAAGREALRQQAPRSEVVCVTDLDGPFFSQPVEQFLRVVGRLQTEDVFAVAASSRPYYYDLLAFESDDFSFLDLDHRIRDTRNPFAYYRLFRDVVYPAQRALTADVDIRCTSAFNGMAVYRGPVYAKGTYVGAPRICEHVTFNRSLRDLTGQCMVVDADWLLPMPTEHGPKGLGGFVAQRLHKLPREMMRHKRSGAAVHSRLRGS